MPRGLADGSPDVRLLGVVVRRCAQHRRGHRGRGLEGIGGLDCGVVVGESGFAQEGEADVASDDCDQEEREDETLVETWSVGLNDKP